MFIVNLLCYGYKTEEQVLPPISMKTLAVPVIPPTTKEDEKILTALKEFLDAECAEKDAYPEDACKTERKIERLSEDKLLVSMLIDRAAYNQTVAVYIINDNPPYNPKPATEDGMIYDSAGGFGLEVQNIGMLHSSARGRGLGDCWIWASWAWTGKSFEKATEGSSGMCRGFGGGAWDLPTFVSKVVNPNAPPEN
ncbi:DUF1176 domain-containing protein [Candidatus Electronema sp. JC]|uniref:DUF1176 domain-containing protein n=1 Tax=Candidatus Electronema sp. JC TaxID=3401570 RepID=UPI003B43B9C2